MSEDVDILIVGGGLVGLSAALACAAKGARVLLVDAQIAEDHLLPKFDGRASAISASSYEMFRHLGVLDHLAGHMQPIEDVLVSDGDVGGPISPLTLHFNARRSTSKPRDYKMGYMVENRRLRRALLQAVRHSSSIDFIAPARLERYEDGPRNITAYFEGGQKRSAKILIGADGRGSKLRSLAKISTRRYPYNQTAIVTTVVHERPHKGVAHELFFPSGPFAILPLTENRSSIVWTDRPHAVKAAMALPEAAFRAELSRRFGDIYGEVGPCAPRWAYPLSMALAEDYIKGRVALIGDAAHAVHPIAGQGLNMGLRDGAALADIYSEAAGHGLDPMMALSEYARWRNFDNSMLAGSMDLLNRLFSNKIPPIRHLRRLGLGIMDKARPAHSFFIREAAGELGDLPSLLRPA